jgi:hypothetical protein
MFLSLSLSFPLVICQLYLVYVCVHYHRCTADCCQLSDVILGKMCYNHVIHNCDRMCDVEYVAENARNMHVFVCVSVRGCAYV